MVAVETALHTNDGGLGLSINEDFTRINTPLCVDVRWL